MANYVDEKIAKISLDNKTFNENARQTLSVLDKLKMAFSKLGDGVNIKGVHHSMNEMSSSIEKSSQKTTGILAKLKSVFKKSNEEFDMSGASKSVDKMNTDIANKTARTSDILSRLKGIFQKADSGIDFHNTTSSIDKLSNKISVFDASGISTAFEKALSSVQNNLTMMDIALGNVLGSMIQKGLGFANQFTSGWRDGLGEYTNKMNSIQTIKSNTESAFGGDTNRQMVQINRTLSELNEYADQTIYSFEDMTRNIGTFTAAGVGLEDSAVAIKGIANLAAASGSSSMQASTAMYQLSQALASGKVNLMDWNSVINAGMGGEVFKNALMETAEAMGVNVDRTKTFRDTLQDGWLTSEVLLETLKKFSTNESMLDAATKVKTFGQLIDTTKEAIGSGWADTWEYVFGGLEEAKGLWSDVSDEIAKYLDDNQGKFFDKTLEMERNLGNFRNAMLKTWKDDGGQQAFFDGIKNSVKTLMGVMDSFRTGWRNVMGDYKTQAKALVDVTNKFRDFTKSLSENKLLKTAATNYGEIFASLTKGALTLGKIFSTAFGMAQKEGSSFIGSLLSLSNAIKNIGDNFVRSGGFSDLKGIFADIGSSLGHAFGFINNAFQHLVSGFASVETSGESFLSVIKKITQSVQDFMINLNNSSLIMDNIYSIGQTLRNILGLFGSLTKAALTLGRVFVTAFGMAQKEGPSVLLSLLSHLNKAIDAINEFINSARFSDVEVIFANIGSSVGHAFRFVNTAIQQFLSGFVSVKLASVDFLDVIKNITQYIQDFMINLNDSSKSMQNMYNAGQTLGNLLGLFMSLSKEVLILGQVFVTAFGMAQKENASLIGSLVTLSDTVIDVVNNFIKSGGFSDLQVIFANVGSSMGHAFSFTTKALKNFVSGFVSVKTSGEGFLDVIKKITQAVQDFMINLNSSSQAMNVMYNAGRTLNNVLAIFKSIITIALQLVASFIPKSADFGNSFEDLSKIILKCSDVLRNWFEDLERSKNKFNYISKVVDELSKGISKMFKGVSEHSPGVFDLLGKAFSKILEYLKPVADGFKYLIGLITPANVLSAGFVVVVYKIIGVLKKLGKHFKDIKEHITGFDSIKSILFGGGDDDSFDWMDALKQGLDNLTAFRNIASLVAIAASIGILSNALETLSKLKTQDIIEGMAVIGTAMHALQMNMNKLHDLKINPGVATTLIAFALALRIISSAINNIGSLKLQDVVEGVSSIVIVLESLSRTMKKMDGLTFNKKTAGIILALGISLKTISDAIKNIGSLKLQDVVEGVSSIVIVLESLSRTMKKMDGLTFNKKTAGIIMALGISLRIIASAIKSIGELELQDVVEGVSSIVIVLESLSRTMKKMDGLTFSNKATGVILALGISLRIIASAIKSIGSLELQDVIEGVGGISIALFGLVQATEAISKVDINPSAATQVMAISVAIRIMASAVKVLGELDIDELVKGLTGMGIVLGSLVVATKALSAIKGSISGAVSIGILATALTLLSVPLKVFASMSLGQVATSLVMLGGSLAILVTAASVAQSVVPGMMALSVALTTLGIAAAGIGALLAGAGYLLQSFGMLFRELQSTTTDSSIKIVTAVKNLVIEFVKATPELTTAFVEMLSNMLDGLIIILPKVVDTAFKLLIEFLKGLKENAPLLITEAANMVSAFAQAIVDNGIYLIDAAFKLVVTLIEGIAEVLPTYAPRIAEALTSIFMTASTIVLAVIKDVVAPLIAGLVDAFRPAIDLIVSVFATLADAIAPVLQPIATVLISLFENLASIINSLASVITSIIQGISTVVHGVVVIIQTITTTIQQMFTSVSTVVQSVGSVIKSVLQGIGSAFQSVGSAIQSVLQGVGSVIQSFGTSVKSILQGVGSTFESAGSGIKSAMEGVGSVIQSIGGSIRIVLNGIAAIFDSVGNAALNAGKGFDKIANGVSQILQYSLGELVSNLGAVADAIVKISAQASGMETAGAGLRAVGSALTGFSASGEMVLTVLQALASTLPVISAAMSSLPAPTQQVVVSMQQLAASVAGMVAPLQAIGTGLSVFSNGMVMLGSALNGVVPTIMTFQSNINNIPSGLNTVTSVVRSTGVAVTTLGSQLSQTASTCTSAFTLISSTATRTFSTMASTISSSMSNTTSAIKSGMQQMTSIISQSMDRSRSVIQSSMTQMTSAIRSHGQQMVSISGTMGQQIGQNMANGLRSSMGSLTSAMDGLVNTIKSHANNGREWGRYVGSMIGQGVAEGMWSAVDSVRSAANAIIESANSAARAAADIHSPSRLFAKTVGRYIPEGVAMGIDKFAHTAVDSTVSVIDEMSNGASRAITTMGENLSDLTTDAMGVVTDAINNALESDLDFSPTISPVVDMDNLKKLDTIASNAEIKMGAIPSLSLPSTDRYHRIDPSSYGSTTTNTSETNININVEMDGAPNPKEFAQQVSREMKRALDAQRMSKGDPVY